MGSSVVINVPSNLLQDDGEKGNADKDFKTKDFFNEAEQEIEKVFIRNGFRVLSRAKFEAKLRDLRDEGRCDPRTDYRCLYSRIDPKYQPMMDRLNEKLKRGEISEFEYAERMDEFTNKVQTASTGKSRQENEKELTDISEVIRAAQSGDIRADYILQINVFDTKKKLRVSTDLRQNPDVRDFINKHPLIKSQMDDSRHHLLSCAIVGAELNAKLIHVATGEIVWIGQHGLNELSSGVQQLSVELGQRTSPTNEDSIKRFVYAQNTEAQRKARYKKDVRLPEWQYTTDLIPATVISGRCEKDWSFNSDTRTRLAREVAKELISSIRVD